MLSKLRLPLMVIPENAQFVKVTLPDSEVLVSSEVTVIVPCGVDGSQFSVSVRAADRAFRSALARARSVTACRISSSDGAGWALLKSVTRDRLWIEPTAELAI